ncbi:hemerythrin family protein [Candidatus Falkowbacteria bacterium]|nr:hemerythrin family protein [Candidatus Falkowbacteria bacterium]
MNELHSVITGVKDKKELEHIIKELANYGQYHLANEEKYFDKFDYVEADAHKAIHKKYIEKISDFQEKFKTSKIKTTFELVDFLEDWWIGHINNIDKRYTKTFNEHGFY